MINKLSEDKDLIIQKYKKPKYTNKKKKKELNIKLMFLIALLFIFIIIKGGF